MTYEITQADLRELLYEVDLFDVDVDECVRWDYSGRGMYGKTCFGITHSGNPAFLLGLGAELQRLAEDSSNEELQERAVDVLQEMRYSASEDSMGRGAIIYFPAVHVTDLEDD